MAQYGRIVIILLVIVVLAAVAYTAKDTFQKNGGSVSIFSSFFREHKNLLPSVPPGFGELEPRYPAEVRIDSSGNVQINVNTRGIEPGGTASTEPAITPPRGFAVSQLSPYYKKFSITDVVPFRGGGETTRFSIAADWSLEEPVDVTGWLLRGRRGELARIPTALSLYSVSASGVAGDIILKPGGLVMVIGRTSPAGQNFRLNLCTGYLNRRLSTTFDPWLPEQCPRLFDPSEYAHLSGICRSFVSSIWGCSVPTADEVNRYALYDNGACSEFLQRFGYGECVGRFQSRSDFYLDAWRVWTGRFIDAAHDYDRLLLFDRNGLLVAEYEY